MIKISPKVFGCTLVRQSVNKGTGYAQFWLREGINKILKQQFACQKKKHKQKQTSGFSEVVASLGPYIKKAASCRQILFNDLYGL